MQNGEIVQNPFAERFARAFLMRQFAAGTEDETVPRVFDEFGDDEAGLEFETLAGVAAREQLRNRNAERLRHAVSRGFARHKRWTQEEAPETGVCVILPDNRETAELARKHGFPDGFMAGFPDDFRVFLAQRVTLDMAEGAPERGCNPRPGKTFSH